MKNPKYLVPIKFANPFILCEQVYIGFKNVEFPIGRESGGLCASIEFAESKKSNVYLKNQNGDMSLVWESKK